MDAILVEIHAVAERYFRRRLRGSWVPGYLGARGLAAAAGGPWGIGYAPGRWTGLVRYLRAAGYAEADVIASGLGKPARGGGLIDRFRDRLMIPVRTVDGTTIAFIGRARPPGAPKYLNSPRTPLYTKGAILYGLDTARPRLAAGAAPVLVEGTLDAIAVTLADPRGDYAPVAPSGTALTRTQVTGLTELTDREIMVAFDADPPGRQAAIRACALLPPGARRALLPPGTDPAGLLQTAGPHALHQALSTQRPLADLPLEAHLAKTRTHPAWSRRDQAAALIATLTPPESTTTIARANSPTGDPTAYPYLPPLAAARLLPAATASLLHQAAEAIHISTTEMTIALITALTERATGIRSGHAD